MEQKDEASNENDKQPKSEEEEQGQEQAHLRHRTDDDEGNEETFSNPEEEHQHEEEDLLSIKRQETNKTKKEEENEEETGLTHLLKTIFWFFIQQEFPTFVCSICLSLAFNYTALLYVREEFRIQDASTVISFDFRARSLECLYWTIEDEKSKLADHVSYFIQTFSSVIPGL